MNDNILIDLNEMAREVHANNQKWWVSLETEEPIERNLGELLMLVVTELAEAAEGARKNLMDDHLPHRKMEEVEIADALIRILDFAGGFKIEFPKFANEVVNYILNVPQDVASIEEFKELNKLDALLKHPVMYITDLYLNIEANHRNLNGEDVVNSLSDFVTSLYVYCAAHDLDIQGAYREKNEYNKTRKDHSLEARRAPNGKKF